MNDLDDLFTRLARSKFRSRFRLRAAEREYLSLKGLEEILKHGERFIEERLAPADPVNDGRQTPMRGHPIFVAQHATATCCRGCLAKWHGINQGQALREADRVYILSVIRRWLVSQGSLTKQNRGDFRQTETRPRGDKGRIAAEVQGVFLFDGEPEGRDDGTNP